MKISLFFKPFSSKLARTGALKVDKVRQFSIEAFQLLGHLHTKSFSKITPERFMHDDFKTTMSDHLRTFYGFKKVVWIDQLGGFSALNYEIQADTVPLILKKYRSTNEDEIMRMERISDFLQAHYLPVLPPLPSLRSNLHFMIEGNIFALFPKTEGEVLHEPLLSKSALLAIASLLAKLHQLDPSSLNLQPLKKRILPRNKIEENAEQTLSMIKKKLFDTNVDRLTRELIKAKLEALTYLISTDLFHSYLESQHFVHGDFHNENILFDQNHQNIVRLLDFEETHLGHRIEDVMHFILIACCNSGYGEANLKKAQLFIQAYASLLPISVEEISFGIHYELFKEFSSFFLEQMLYNTRDLFFAKLIERDLRKIAYFKDHMGTFIKSLSP